MPNPHDIGSARLLARLGFEALATTSAGFAASIGQLDSTISRDQLVDHVRMIAASTELPINVDSEQCFPEADGGVATTVTMLGEAGAAGCSIEDWNRDAKTLDAIELAVARVTEAAEAANRAGLVLTARAENHLRGVDDLDDTIARLCAYRDAGAHCVYAPALIDLASIKRIVDETAVPVNVLLLPGGPTVAELANVGVRRISVGNNLARIAYGAFVASAQQLLDEGMLDPTAPYLDRALAGAAFTSQPV